VYNDEVKMIAKNFPKVTNLARRGHPHLLDPEPEQDD